MPGLCIDLACSRMLRLNGESVAEDVGTVVGDSEVVDHEALIAVDLNTNELANTCVLYSEHTS